MNKTLKLGKYPHNMIIDVFGKDSANAEEAVLIYTDMIKRLYPDGWGKHALVLKYYYMEGLTLGEIASEMDLCKERIRQILAKNKRMLQSVSLTLFPDEIPDDTMMSNDISQHFSVRTTHALFRYGIRTTDDILNISPDVLSGIHSIGKCGLEEIMRLVGQKYFDRWFPSIAGSVDVSKIDGNSIYRLCKNYKED